MNGNNNNNYTNTNTTHIHSNPTFNNFTGSAKQQQEGRKYKNEFKKTPSFSSNMSSASGATNNSNQAEEFGGFGTYKDTESQNNEDDASKDGSNPFKGFSKLKFRFKKPAYYEHPFFSNSQYYDGYYYDYENSSPNQEQSYQPYSFTHLNGNTYYDYRQTAKSYTSDEIQQLIDSLVDDPDWWNYFTNPPNEKKQNHNYGACEFDPRKFNAKFSKAKENKSESSSSSPSSMSSSSSSDENSSSESGVFCYINDIIVNKKNAQVKLNHDQSESSSSDKKYIIEENSDREYVCENEDELLYYLDKIAKNQKRNTQDEGLPQQAKPLLSGHAKTTKKTISDMKSSQLNKNSKTKDKKSDSGMFECLNSSSSSNKSSSSLSTSGLSSTSNSSISSSSSSLPRRKLENRTRNLKTQSIAKDLPTNKTLKPTDNANRANNKEIKNIIKKGSSLILLKNNNKVIQILKKNEINENKENQSSKSCSSFAFSKSCSGLSNQSNANSKTANKNANTNATQAKPNEHKEELKNPKLTASMFSFKSDLNKLKNSSEIKLNTKSENTSKKLIIKLIKKDDVPKPVKVTSRPTTPTKPGSPINENNRKQKVIIRKPQLEKRLYHFKSFNAVPNGTNSITNANKTKENCDISADKTQRPKVAESTQFQNSNLIKNNFYSSTNFTCQISDSMKPCQIKGYTKSDSVITNATAKKDANKETQANLSSNETRKLFIKSKLKAKKKLYKSKKRLNTNKHFKTNNFQLLSNLSKLNMNHSNSYCYHYYNSYYNRCLNNYLRYLCVSSCLNKLSTSNFDPFKLNDYHVYFNIINKYTIYKSSVAIGYELRRFRCLNFFIKSILKNLILNNVNRVETSRPSMSSKSSAMCSFDGTSLNNITTWQTKKEQKEKLAAKSSGFLSEYEINISQSSNLNQKGNETFDLKEIGIKPKYYSILLSIIANAKGNEASSKNNFNIGFDDLFANVSPNLINQLKKDLKNYERYKFPSCDRPSSNRFNLDTSSKCTNSKKFLLILTSFESLILISFLR
jgi:hypothetical protein